MKEPNEIINNADKYFAALASDEAKGLYKNAAMVYISIVKALEDAGFSRDEAVRILINTDIGRRIW